MLQNRSHPQSKSLTNLQNQQEPQQQSREIPVVTVSPSELSATSPSAPTSNSDEQPLAALPSTDLTKDKNLPAPQERTGRGKHMRDFRCCRSGLTRRANPRPTHKTSRATRTEPRDSGHHNLPIRTLDNLPFSTDTEFRRRTSRHPAIKRPYRRADSPGSFGRTGD